MEIAGRIVVVTGAASGIGRALAQSFTSAGAKLVVSADLDADGAEDTAGLTGGVAMPTDVSREDDIRLLVQTVEERHGPIDIFCSNAGILVTGGPEVDNAAWQRIWDINVMAHVWAARHVVPRMVARGGGYLLNTASAAGLLNQVGAAPYATTKHAAVGFAEWLSITYGDNGIGVSVLCPQSVRTAMTQGRESVAAVDGQIEPGPVAEACLDAIRAGRFLVLPHPEVLEYMRRKTSDYDRWLGGMRRLNRRFAE